MKKSTTHFGFQAIPWEDKANRVNAVFNSVAEKYDLMNNIMSFGLHHLWKYFAVKSCIIRQTDTVLDLASGSGDLASLLYPRICTKGKLYLIDLNRQMLSLARDKLIDKGYYQNIHYIQANAEQLPIANSSINLLTIAFGLRNVRDQKAALASMFRVCKPGAKLIILEFSKPTLISLQHFYDWYSFNIIPKLGKIVVNDADSYKYLVESIRMHPNQEQLKTMIEQAGFEDCKYHNLACGIVALHIAYKY